MKFSLNTIKFLNQHYDSAGDPAPDGSEALIQRIGAQLGEIDGVIEFGKRFEDVVIAKVVSCQKHPDADRLRICMIDDGGKTPDIDRNSEGHVQVVCGAPNAREGLLVAWLPPGATVPDSHDKEPFVLEARDIRGQISNGMLASPKELGLSDDHDGILEIILDADEDIVPGTRFIDAYHLKDDIIIDIENKMFTHRPDCFGYLGIARELEAIQHRPYKSPDWYTPTPAFPAMEAEELKLEVRNELPELVPRFVVVTMRNVDIKPSPTWLQVDLARAGLRPINNIVDYTNWFMLQTGQPIHIYDYDKVKAASGDDGAAIVVRNPKPGETIKLLNGKTIEPRPQAMMVATDKKLICLGGAMGGAETEVDNDTKNIIVEAANWDMFNMRRTAMEHGVFTDAVTRFTKGQSPLQNPAVISRIVKEIREHAGGKIAGPLIDDNHLDQAVLDRLSIHPPVKVSPDFINTRLGLELPAEEMQGLLRNVEFDVQIDGDELVVTAPFWRTDIELREDVVEEIGRLYGYDKLPLDLPKRDLTPAAKDPLLALKSEVRQRLSAAGANEVLTYSFVHGDLLDKAGQDKAQAFQISNALSPDLQYYRLSLTPSLLEKVHPNIKAGYDQFALFELGKSHVQGEFIDPEPEVPYEFERLALVFAANDKAARTHAGAAYYEAREYLMNLLSDFGLADKVILEELDETRYVGATKLKITPYEASRAATIRLDNVVLGEIGEYKSSVRQALKLPGFSAGFELDLSVLLAQGNHTKNYVALPRFPKVTQDITLKVPAGLSYQELLDFVRAETGKVQPDNTLPVLGPVDIYQKPDDPDHKQVTLRLSIASYDRTLTDAEVNKLLDAVATAAKTKLNAQRI